MSRYRNDLPQLSGGLFVTDGGLETDLIFHDGYQLPQNAAYVLLAEPAGVDRLAHYFADYVEIADRHGLGMVLETATWRASADWAAKIGTSPEVLAALNRKGVEMVVQLRDRRPADAPPFVVSGCLGPRSDAYQPTEIMTPREAQVYHAVQINTFRDTEADMIAAMTLTNISEAIGVVRAARAAQMPVTISFTVETDGRLPTGPTLREAIDEVDAATDGTPIYYMINCAHPTHFERVLEPGESWTERIGGVRANSSTKSHAELNESPTLDEGNPVELGGQYKALVTKFPHFRVLGGCCGTDSRHVREIAAACARSVSVISTDVTSQPREPFMEKTTLAVFVTILFSVIGVVGDYFLKLASGEPAWFKSKWFYLGFLIYASTAFGWVFVMKHLKLATIGVVYSVSMILLLSTIGVLRFNETLSIYEIAGILMAIGSLVLLMRFA